MVETLLDKTFQFFCENLLHTCINSNQFMLCNLTWYASSEHVAELDRL